MRSSEGPHCPKADEAAIRTYVANAVLKGRGSKHHKEGQALPPLPEPLSDYLFSEALGFRVLPWELDEMPVDVYAYWSQVIGTYQDEKSKRELQRQKSEQDVRGRKARR